MKKIVTRLATILTVAALSATCFAAVPEATQTTVTAEAAGKSGVYKESGTWYYYVDGVKQTNFTGLANYRNEAGWWYITNGKVDRSVNTVAKNKNGWWYVVNGKVQKNFTGLANYKNASGWWYIKNGKVDRSYNGLAKNKNGWWYVKSGKVDRSYTGFATNSSGKWYVEKGKVTKSTTGVFKDSKGTLGSKDAWYYVKNSKVQTGYTGLAKNSSGTWYIKNGKVDRSYNGTYTSGGTTYTISGGKVTNTSGSSGSGNSGSSSSGSGSSGSSGSGSTAASSNKKTVNGVTFDLSSFPETYKTSSGGYLFVGVRPESSINYNDITYKISGNTVTKFCDENTEKVYMPSTYNNYAVYEIGSSWSSMVAQVEVYYEEQMYIPFRVEIAPGFKTGSFSISAYYKGDLIGTCKINQDRVMDWRPERIARSIEEAAWTDDMTRYEKMSAMEKYIKNNYTYSELNCTGGASVLYIAARDLGYTNVRFRNVDTSTYDYGGTGDVYVYNSAGWGGGHTCLVSDGDEESGGKERFFEAQGGK